MPYLSSIERMAEQRGRQEGRQEGLEHERSLILRLLTRRIQDIPADLEQQVKQLPLPP